MTPQEKDLITTLLARLKNVGGGQPKDTEAETLILQALAEQPDAPYYLVQTVLIQDLALHNAQNRITELERQLADAQASAAKPGTSFLGGLFGRSDPAPAPAPTAGPWSRSPQVAAAPPQPPYGQPGYAAPPYAQPPTGSPGFLGGSMGGGFLQSAAATAAGVAGGALLFEGISSLFGQHASAGILGGQSMTPGLGETVVNNYYGSDAGNTGSSNAGFDPGPGADQDFTSQDQDFSSDQDFSGGDDPGGGGGDFTSC
jgi:hypothetical protein